MFLSGQCHSAFCSDSESVLVLNFLGQEPTHEGGSGSAPDVTDCMREELHRLRYENLSLKGRVEEITNRLEAFSMQDTIPASPGIHPKDFHDEVLQEGHPSDDAVRKRLDRMIKPRANGTLGLQV